MGAVAVQGLEAQEGETAFAFLVVRLREPRDRDGVVAVLRYIAALIPDADTFIEEWPEEIDEPVRIMGMPWVPPEAGHAVDAQRRLIESAGSLGVEAAWFFQTGTSLPSDDEDLDDDDDDLDDDEDGTWSRRASTNVDDVGDATDTQMTTPVSRVSAPVLDDEDPDATAGWEKLGDDDEDTGRRPRLGASASGEIGGRAASAGGLVHDDDDEDVDDAAGVAAVDDDDDTEWSHGPPPQATKVRFPVDGYPAIIEELDWEDFGIAVKLSGAALPGLASVLFGFHSLWLAPYGGRFRNTAVTYDRKHNAAHFWVDRFAVPTGATEQVHHLLWVISKLDQIVPIVHARFAEASMSQKYGGLMGETSEPFVLGGNPLLAAFVMGGDANVDRWIAEQTAWSKEEVAAMLRELAIEIVTTSDEAEDAADASADEVDADFGEPGDEDRDDDEPDAAADDDGDDEGEDDDESGRQITSFAGEILKARAAAGTLHPRAAEQLLPVLDRADRYEHRRSAVVDIFGALRYKPAVPAMIKILETTTIKNSLDSIGKEDFIAATAAALGAIGDPAAISALAKVVAAPGTHNDKPRPVAADALASCLQATPEPRHVDDAVLAELLTTISERNDGELNAETHFAYGKLVRQLPPERRAEARRKLADADTARDDAIAMLARQAALLLASPTTPIDAPPRDLQPLLRESLTSLDYDHEYTVRNLRVALRVAEIVPDLVEPDDIVWLTRFAEPDIRRSAHALLAKLGKPLAEAPAFDRMSVQAADDKEIVRLISEAHVVGRAALIGEAHRRRLTEARRAVIDACHDVISRARQGGENLLDPDTRVLDTAVPFLREPPLDADVIALFDRMLRHSNVHVKWELVEEPPIDDRLLGGMFHVLGEKWGWQEKAARTFLARFQDTPAYEIERRKAGSPSLEEPESRPSDGDANDDGDDEDMN